MSDDKPPVEAHSASPQSAKLPEPISFAEFLEGVPPSQWQPITDLWSSNTQRGTFLRTPELRLHCTTETCNGLRFFRFKDGDTRFGGESSLNTYLTYARIAEGL